MSKNTKKPNMQEKLAEYFQPEELGPLPEDFNNHNLVVNPTWFNEAYRSKENMVWRVTGGFGCDPTAIGRAVFAVCLGDGEEARFDRGDFVAAYVGVPIKTITRRQRMDALTEVLVEMDYKTLKENLPNLYSHINDAGIKRLCKHFDLKF